MMRGADDTGVATLFALGMLTALSVVVGATAATAQWAITRSQVALVADLAAVAAAGSGACGSAEITARAHHVELLECSWHGTDVTVRVGTQAAGFAARLLDGRVIAAQARAGY
jgi:secretion/DNA translocation related TadE-like protein